MLLRRAEMRAPQLLAGARVQAVDRVVLGRGDQLAVDDERLAVDRAVEVGLPGRVQRRA